MFNIAKMLFGEKANFKELIEQGAWVIDVRTPGEYQSGHVPAAVNIPLDNLTAKLEEIKSKNKPVITVCRSGARSAAATDILKKAGIETYNGGAWTDFSKHLN